MMPTSSVCSICKTPMDQPNRVWTMDCGGDCLTCMADAGDPECVRALTHSDAAYLRGWQERGKRDAEIAAAQDWAMGTAFTVAHIIASAIRAIPDPEPKS